MLKNLETTGESVLLAQEGQAQLARELLAVFGRGMQRVRDWLAAMPTNLPPVEARVRK